jgi:streptogramin lyase
MWKLKATWSVVALVVLALVVLALTGCGAQGASSRTPTVTTQISPLVDIQQTAYIANLGDTGTYSIKATDTAVWVHNGAQQVFRIDPKTNKVVAAIKVGRGLGGLAIGDGVVWVLCREDPSLWRIDIKTNKAVATIKLPVPMASVTLSPGAVWAASATYDTVVRVDANTNRITSTIKVVTSSTPKGIVYAGGSIWLCNSGTPQEGLTRLDPSTGQATAHINLNDPVSRTCDGIFAYGDSIWTVMIGGSAPGAAFERVDIATNTVAQHLPFDDIDLYSAFAVDTHGLWATDGNILYVINTQTGQIVGQYTATDETGLAVGADATWYGTSDNGGGLVRFVATP